MPSRSEDPSSVDFRDDVASAGVSMWVSAERDGFESSFPIDVFPQLKGVIELNTDPVSLSILNAARELVIENGLSKTRMTSIAKLAGVSRPTLYSRYSNVRDVTTTLLTHEVVNALIIGHVQAVDEGGSVAMRSGDPRVIATVLMNIAQSFSFSYGVLHDSIGSVDTWLGELNALVTGYLRA